jgi:ribosomal peptide maturation radical SAM protein 1
LEATVATTPAVVLASMPWAPVTEPSLAMGILVAQARRAGFRARSMHLNIDLLEHVTFETYVKVAEYWALNEFVFTELLSEGVDDAQTLALIDRCAEHLSGDRISPRYATVESLLDMLLKFRFEVAPGYLQQCAEKVLAERPTMLGLTCMFDQTLASVALAKLVKERSPETLVVLGGYAVQGPAGDQVLKSFPWIDGIARGDGEDMIVALGHASIDRAALPAIDGLLVRDHLARPHRNSDLENSPDPDYTDWFRDVAELERQRQVKIATGTLPVESSRGCWWGQVKHCVFCGIDDETMKFRHKTPERVFAMLEAMRCTYGDFEFRFSDYILPKPYFDHLLPRLAALNPPYRLKCEIKANQTPERVSALARAGFKEVQPGIESFSSDVLKLMDKGVTGIQNVSLLKHGYLNEIVIHYNFLFGIPGETADHYRELRQNFPRLYHLTPPVSRSEAIVTRFAPLQNNPDRFGFTVKPVHHRCYDVLFSQDTLARTGFSLDDYAYYFARHRDFSDEMLVLYHQCIAQINHWKAQHRDREVTLDYEDDGDRLRVRDSRYGDETVTCLGGVARATYLACDAAPALLKDLVPPVCNEFECAADEVMAAVDLLDDRRLIWRERDRILGLAVPRAIAEARLASNWRMQWVSIFR